MGDLLETLTWIGAVSLFLFPFITKVAGAESQVTSLLSRAIAYSKFAHGQTFGPSVPSRVGMYLICKLPLFNPNCSVDHTDLVLTSTDVPAALVGLVACYLAEPESMRQRLATWVMSAHFLKRVYEAAFIREFKGGNQGNVRRARREEEKWN